MTREMEGLVALVTGGASGIGAATADRLSELGAGVAVLDLTGEAANSEHFPVRCDISDDASVKKAVKAVVEHFGRLDIVINNAGVGAQGTVEDNDDDEWHRVFDVNVVGMVRVSRAALPHLRESPAAAIVNICSVAASAGLQARALYGATKGAVLALTMSMAADHIGEGIRVNCVNPGTADTPWIARLLDKSDDPRAERAALEARQPHGRLVRPEEVAAAISYLASPLAGSTTATSLAVDGGLQGVRLRPIRD